MLLVAFFTDAQLRKIESQANKGRSEDGPSVGT